MKLSLDISLDPTLGCGQAHRWKKMVDGSWQGLIKNNLTTVREIPGGIEFHGCSMEDAKEYFRTQDDLEYIVRAISAADPYVAELSSKCPGLRILKQPEWECLGTYLLATNVNVKRISKMVESVCDHFGTDVGGRCAFPTPGQILDGRESISECKLGFREQRFIELAERTESGDIDLRYLGSLEYTALVEELQNIKGVGPKVADCVALFGFGKMEAFPIDVRIQKIMKTRYGIEGSYRTVSDYGRKIFGPYSGYAQEFLYHSDFI